MMHGHGKSDSVIVAMKPTNNAERSAAEPVEPRTGTKGNADQQSTRRAQDRESVARQSGWEDSDNQDENSSVAADA